MSIELATDNRALSSNNNQNQLDAGIPPCPRRETSSSTQCGVAGRGDLPAESWVDDRRSDIQVKETSSRPDVHIFPHMSRRQVEEETEILLHTLLMVPDGRNFSCESTKAPNVYLNCKLFWSDGMARSIVSWGQANPSFHFVQVGTGIIPRKSKTVHFYYSVIS